ncbi:insulinase family protein [Pedobacter sp. MC2016-24]|nr:insulinase family protein [Pedobacter sp. MC2016-24]
MKLRNMLLVVLLLAVQVAFGQQLIPVDPKVKTGKLSNGFTYFIRQNQHPENRVVMYLVNKVGSILETDEQLGLAHFMEHMSFNGTTHFPKNELVDYLQKAGVRFGADLNAYTGFEETVYELPIPTDRPGLLDNGIRIMRDWANSALLDPLEIDKERGVILEEKRLKKSVAERLREQYFSVILNGSRYASRLPIGTDEVLKHFKPATLERFYQDWYRPNLQAIIVVGDIDPAHLESVIKKEFSGLKNPVSEKPRPSYSIPLNNKNQFISLTDKEQTSTQIEVLIKQQALKVSTVGDYRQLIMRSLCNQMLKSRCDEIMLRADAPFLQANMGINSFLGGLDAFSLSITARPGALESGFKAAWVEVTRLKQFGFTAPELDRAKKSFLVSMESAWKEQDKTASEKYAKEYVQLFLNNVAAPGIEKEYELTKKALPEITLEEMHQFVLRAIKDVNRDIMIMAPEREKAGLPSQERVDSWIKAIELQKQVAYTEGVTMKDLLIQQPTAGTIVSESFNKEIGFTKITMKNGLTVFLKKTAFKNDEILFTAFGKGGTSVYDIKDYQSAANAANLIPAAGIGNLNSSELQKYLSGKKLQVVPYISYLTQGISGSSGNQDLETALKLTHAYFTEARNDKAIFESIIERSKATIVNRGSDPNSVFQDSSLALIYANHPRMGGPTLHKLLQIDNDRAYTIFKERFSDAANFTFIFVGSIDTVTIRPLLEKYLGSLPATNAREQFKDRGIVPVTGRLSKNIYKGREQKATVNLLFSGAYSYGLEENVQMAALKEVLQIRIMERLREAESGVYSPQVTITGTKYPKAVYQCQITFGCAPENVDKLISSALDEIKRLKNDGPSQIDVDKWKAEFRRTLETQRQTNIYWLSKVSTYLQNDLSLTSSDFNNAIVDKITPQTVREAANLYFNDKNYIRLTLLPEKENH